MNSQTRQRVKEIMLACIAEYAPRRERWESDDVWQAYPFHRLFFTGQEITSARAERSIVTSMGSYLYPRLAEAIAGGRFNDVRLEYTIEGVLNDDACNLLEQIVTELRAAQGRRRRRRVPNHEEELNRILAVRTGNPRSVTVTADLYIGDFVDGPLFVELKTPRPNLDIAAETKTKILYFLSMMNRTGITSAQAFLGLTYNPFLTRAQYAHTPTRQVMDMESEVLIGSELWDHIGGPGTYDEMLAIISEINPD